MLLLSAARQETAAIETAAGSSAELIYLGRVRIVSVGNLTLNIVPFKNNHFFSSLSLSWGLPNFASVVNSPVHAQSVHNQYNSALLGSMSTAILSLRLQLIFFLYTR